jgi:thioredoxin 1
MIRELEDETELTNLLASKTPVLLKFEADWCGPCRAIAPYVNELADNHTDITVRAINADKPSMYNVLQTYKVRSIPHLVYISPAGEIKTLTGARSKKDIYSLVGRSQ